MNPVTRKFDPSVVKVTDEIVTVANEAYHDVEASMYDDSHPEILWCEKTHWEAFGRSFLSDLGHPISILDIAAGTGFVGSAIEPFLDADDKYVAADLSENMLVRLRDNLREFRCRVETVKAASDSILYQDSSFDVITVNSAFHHFPNVEATLREISRLLRPGGIFVTMHEPNIRFVRSGILRSNARLASIIAMRMPIRKTAQAKAGSRDYASAYEAVNSALLVRGLIEKPLSHKDIQALVDVSSPTARGTYENVGLDPFSWVAQGGVFSSWKVLKCETYNYFGKLDPTERSWSRLLERVQKALFPRSGYLFSLVVQKPKA